MAIQLACWQITKSKNVLYKLELSSRLTKWAIKLGEHTLQYKPRPTIKGKVLTDFIAEVPTEKEEECRAEEESTVIVEENEEWMLSIDGASGAGLKIVRPSKQNFTNATRLDFKSKNKEA